MILTFRFRFALLASSIAVLAALTVWAVWASGRHVDELQRRLTAAHLSSFRIAGEFQRRVLTLNNMMLRFAAGRDPAVWSAFEEASTHLDLWVEEVKPKLHTERERNMLNELSEGYDRYQRAARKVQTTEPLSGLPGEALSAIDDFEIQAQHLLGLGNQLAEAHREAREAFLGQANVHLGHLRSFLYGGVGLSLALVAGLGWLLYRDLIAPLRTRLVQSEALLERQEKLATLGTLAAGIAHEIRNPLTSIKACLFTLGKRLKENQAAAADAAIISGEITRLERIVRDVLQFARPSDPELKLKQVEQTLREVQSLMGGTVDKSRVQLSVEPGPELWVSMDTALIQQVLINLVRNAVESIEGQGEVTMRARRGRAKLHGENRDVVILEVADTGKGIPPEIERRLFDPFFTTKEAGTGLGLSIAARIVEKHGGALQYRTQPGWGTTFGIVLPLATGSEPAHHQGSPCSNPEQLALH